MVPSSAELVYFSEVAVALNLSRASKKLGVSQPSLSLAIKRLEQTMGTHLFIRHKHGVTLTIAGKKLLAHVNQLLQYWDDTKSITQTSHQETQGRVLLGCNSILALFLHRFLPGLLESHPRLEVHLQHDNSMKITEQVVNSIIDIGIVIEQVKHPALIARKVSESETTFWTGCGTRKIQDIHSNQSVIICDPEIPQTQLLLKKCKLGNQESRRFLISNNIEVIAHLAANGCGIGILPACITELRYSNQLTRVPNAPSFSYGIYLIYRKENRNVKAVQVIIEAIKDSL